MAELIKPINILSKDEVIEKMSNLILDEISENIKLSEENSDLLEKDKKHKEHCRRTLFEDYYSK